ncbi:hypothetical protein CB1_000349016 [Camelus ferus]|nr:hypothetical protein CB1_000349016 [Camelus ferus]
MFVGWMLVGKMLSLCIVRTFSQQWFYGLEGSSPPPLNTAGPPPAPTVPLLLMPGAGGRKLEEIQGSHVVSIKDIPATVLQMRKDGLERVARINLDGSVQISWLGCPFLDREEQNGGTTGASEWGLRGDSFVIFTFGSTTKKKEELGLKVETSTQHQFMVLL